MSGPRVGRFTASIVGGDKLAAAFAKNADLALAALGAGMYDALAQVMTESKTIVPVDEGVLKGSGYVTLPVVTGSAVVVEAGFGGPAAKYAVVVHEKAGTHPHHPGNLNCSGDWKYLERPLARARPTLMRHVGRVAALRFKAGNAGPPAALHPTNPNGGA